MTFQPRSLILESNQYIKTWFSQKRANQTQVSYASLQKFYKCHSYMTKMAAMPIFGKTL